MHKLNWTYAYTHTYCTQFAHTLQFLLVINLPACWRLVCSGAASDGQWNSFTPVRHYRL